MRLLVIGSVFARHAGDDQVPWLRESCRQLHAAGVQVELLVPSHRGLRSHTIDGMTVHRFRYAPAELEKLTGEEGAPSKLRRNPWMKLLAVSYLWCGFWALIWRLCRTRYDLVEVHWPHPHAYLALPAVWAGVPVIYHYHSAELKLAAQSKLSERVFASVLPLARAHIANSSYTAGLIKKLRPELPVAVIPYGAAMPLVAEKTTDDARKLTKLLFVGRHIERKGVTYPIAAMQLLPADTTLTIVGEGDQTEALKQQAAGDARITFTGRLSSDALAQAYATHDIFLLPAIIDSRGDTEGLGVVLLEAIAAGLPVVASAVGGIVDIIEDGKTGLLVPPAEPKAIADAVVRLQSEAGLAQRLRAQAEVAAREYFGWAQITERTLAVYKEAVNKK